MTRMEFYRDTLIRNVELAVRNAQEEDLPATIKAVYAFGGILRDKEKLHDFDSVFLYEQNSQQKERWERFRRNFSSMNEDDREISHQQLHDLLDNRFLAISYQIRLFDSQKIPPSPQNDSYQNTARNVIT